MTAPIINPKRNETSVLWRLLLSFTFLLLSTTALYFFLHSPAFGIKEVVVEGNQSLGSAEIIRLSGVVPGTNIFLLDEEQIQGRLHLHSLLETVKIERRLPNRLIIQVQERVPCLLLPVTDGFVVVDHQGVYLTRVGSIVEINRPVVTGCVVPPDVLPGQVIDVVILQQFLPVVDQMSFETVQSISEINLESAERIKIYSLNGVEIKVGTIDHLVEHLDLLQQILTVELKQLDQPIEYIDMSFKGSPVIKFAQGKTR
jgi:cell division protein FtsQ